jgi:hypothetical protein
VIYTTYDLPPISNQRMSFDYTGQNFDVNDGSFTIASNYNFSLKVYWGDGTTDICSGTYFSAIHNYPINSIWKIEFEFISGTAGGSLYLAFDNAISSPYTTNIYNNFQNIKSFANHTNFDSTIIYGARNWFYSSAEVNDFLHQGLHLINGDTCAIYDNTPPAPPTGQGITDVAIMQSNGVNVVTD